MQVGAADFAFRGAGDLGEEADAEGERDQGGEGGFQGGLRRVRGGDGADDDGVGGGAGAALQEGDVPHRGGGQDFGLELGGGDFGAAEVQDVVAAADQGERVVRRKAGDVPGEEMAVVEHGFSGLRVVLVGLNHAGGSDVQRAGLAWRERGEVRRENFDLDAGEEVDAASGVDGADRADFVGAIIFDDAAGEFLQRGVAQISRELGADGLHGEVGQERGCAVQHGGDEAAELEGQDGEVGGLVGGEQVRQAGLRSAWRGGVADEGGAQAQAVAGGHVGAADGEVHDGEVAGGAGEAEAEGFAALGAQALAHDVVGENHAFGGAGGAGGAEDGLGLIGWCWRQRFRRWGFGGDGGGEPEFRNGQVGFMGFGRGVGGDDEVGGGEQGVGVRFLRRAEGGGGEADGFTGEGDEELGIGIVQPDGGGGAGAQVLPAQRVDDFGEVVMEGGVGDLGGVAQDGDVVRPAARVTGDAGGDARNRVSGGRRGFGAGCGFPHAVSLGEDHEDLIEGGDGPAAR